MSRDERIGTQVAGYRVQSLLGRGGMGVVYEAEHVTLQRPAALKLLSGELARDASLRDRFIRESRLAASLDHPHIVPVFDAGEADGAFYLVMRLIEGRDLKKVIKTEGPLEPSRVAALLAGVADALDAAHEAGLVHRDVKPENILVGVGRGGSERPYLTDFGLTKRRDSATALTATGTMLGTIDYVAPEQVQGDDTDGRADVYALGCVAYECLTGRPPFSKDSEMSTLYAHVHEQAPPASSFRAGLAAGVDEVVARAMAKSKEDRYRTCGAFIAALAEAFGDEHETSTVVAPQPVLAGPVPPQSWPPPPASAPIEQPPQAGAPTPPPRTSAPRVAPKSRPITRRPLIIAVAAVALVLVVVAVAVWATTGPDPEELLAVEPEGELVSSVDNLSASSTAPLIVDEDDFEIDFVVDNLYDENRDSAWRTAGDGRGERINLLFDEAVRVTSIGLLPGWARFEDGVDFFFANRRVLEVEYEFSDGSTITREFAERPQPQYVRTDVTTNFVIVRILETSGNEGQDFTAISDIEIYQPEGADE